MLAHGRAGPRPCALSHLIRLSWPTGHAELCEPQMLPSYQYKWHHTSGPLLGTGSGLWVPGILCSGRARGAVKSESSQGACGLHMVQACAYSGCRARRGRSLGTRAATPTCASRRPPATTRPPRAPGTRRTQGAASASSPACAAASLPLPLPHEYIHPGAALQMMLRFGSLWLHAQSAHGWQAAALDWLKESKQVSAAALLPSQPPYQRIMCSLGYVTPWRLL